MSDPLKELREARRPFSFHYGGQPGDTCGCPQCKLITVIDAVLNTPPPTGEVGEALRLIHEARDYSTGGSPYYGKLSDAILVLESLRPSPSHPQEIEYEGKKYKIVPLNDPIHEGDIFRTPTGGIHETLCPSMHGGYTLAGGDAYRPLPVEPAVVEWEHTVTKEGVACIGDQFPRFVGHKGKRFHVVATEIVGEE